MGAVSRGAGNGSGLSGHSLSCLGLLGVGDFIFRGQPVRSLSLGFAFSDILLATDTAECIRYSLYWVFKSIYIHVMTMNAGTTLSHLPLG